MKFFHALVFCPAIFWATLPGHIHAAATTPGDGGLPADYSVRDPAAPAVTGGNIFLSERFWPYQVTLDEDTSVGTTGRLLPKGTSGVLLRVEASGMARIDFGRDGLETLPLAKTDLLARANAIRLGTETKTAPNFVLALGPRALNAAKSPPEPVSLKDWGRQAGFLCVFARPTDPAFAALAAELRALPATGRFLTLLFPMGETTDRAIAQRLQTDGWPVVFLRDHLAESYAASLLPEPYAAPCVLLVSPEGRVLHYAPWTAGAGAAVRAAMAKAIDG
jgi:hypothetical protein